MAAEGSATQREVPLIEQSPLQKRRSWKTGVSAVCKMPSKERAGGNRGLYIYFSDGGRQL